MERTVSTEERIRRAEEIYARRQGNKRTIATVNVNYEKGKDIKLLKKMGIQIVICISIYLIIYTIVNNEYIFSEDFRNQLNSILSYDTNFMEIYETIKNKLYINNIEDNSNDTVIENGNQSQESDENNEEKNDLLETKEETNTESEVNETNEVVESTEDISEQLSEEEQEIKKVKETASFIKPIEGSISSDFGQREKTSANIPTNHTGVDIASNIGTKIKSATDGEVVLVSEEGDFGKHVKIQIGEVSVIYAHCNAIYVNQGDQIKQGQEIAEVGSTGNSTGPHLHFEIRLSEKPIDPKGIIEL